MLKRLLFLVALTLAPLAPAQAVPTTRTVEVVYVLFGGNPTSATPAPNLNHNYGENLPADAATKLSWVNGDWSTISYHRMNPPAVLGAVYGYITVPLDTTICVNPGDVTAQNQIAAEANKLIPPPASGAIRWYYIPIGCGNSHPNFPFGNNSHEFGHSIGFAHDHDVFLNGTTTSVAEYGARSVMGGQGTNLSAVYKDTASMFDATYSIVTARASDGSADVKLTAFDVVSPGIKALKIVAPQTTCSPFIAPPNNCTTSESPQYYVEFRPGRQGGRNEVLVRKAGGYLLDLDPTSGVRYGMNVGETLCYPAPTNACITLVGFGPEPTADVQVTFNGAPPPPPPPPPPCGTGGSGPFTGTINGKALTFTVTVDAQCKATGVQ